MPNTVTSPNMNIVVPVNLTDPSPDWGARLQTALQTTIDSHDHSSGKGVQVTPAGLNVNADLPFGSNNATALRSSRFTAQGSPLALGTDVGCIYVSGNELWYNDEAGRQVQLTNVGAVNTAPQALIVKTVTTSYTILSTDTFQLFYYLSGTAATAITLPSSALVAPGRYYWFVDRDGNGAVNALTLTPNGGDTINGTGTSLVVPLNNALTLLTTDAAGRWLAQTIQQAPAYGGSTIGLGTGTVTLTAANLRNNIIQFSGTLSGAVTIVFPNAPGYFMCDFSQVVMGANTIAVKSGTTTSATAAAANIGSTATINQLSLVATYGGNTIRFKA